MKSQRQKLIVVGNGMVGFRFCRELAQCAPDRYRTTVFAEEERPAYDRIHLTSVLHGRRIEDLTLAPRSWYQHNRVELVLGDPIVSIDRRRRVAVSSSGREAPYDRLVVATGAEPVVPAMPGCDLPGVITYRTATDVLTARLHARRCSSAAVLGGGLLGLEVAKALAEMGIETYAIEAANHIMPRQLDALSADLVHEQIERSGVRIAVQRRVLGVRSEAHCLFVDLLDSPPIAVDLVVFAIGVRPRDKLARASGLVVDDRRGGIAVDDHLVTSDPRIMAIGDCARHAGIAYGLVGPGYQMARVAADRLAGGAASFTGTDPSCRLNVAGVEVAALGDCGDADARQVVYQEGEVRRTLTVRGQCIVGVRCVGPWPSLIAIERAMAEKRPLGHGDLQRFTRSGDVWTDGDPEVTTIRGYGDTATVCHCAHVTFGQVRGEMARGCCTLATIGAATGAGTVCGTCRPLLAQLCGDRSPAPVRARWPLLVASLLALAGVGAFIGLTPLKVQLDGPLDWLSQFWRDSAGKKMSGFILVGASGLVLVLSLRKRLRLLRRTSLTWFRLFHAVIGALTLAVLLAHTGLHVGNHLNRLLLVTFLGVVATGGMVGVVTASSGRAGAASVAALRRARSWLMGGHWLFLWLLPVLIAFHVIAAFYF
ncbi:MAG TPA: FAD-dependent oxidoreductase [Kofleriaceae bacterium]|nr:FAD-dependent oxidoreductase [Kofleriaceae bacterium]